MREYAQSSPYCAVAGAWPFGLWFPRAAHCIEGVFKNSLGWPQIQSPDNFIDIIKHLSPRIGFLCPYQLVLNTGGEKKLVNESQCNPRAISEEKKKKSQARKA